MGWQQYNIFANTVVVFGPGESILIYSGTPAAGNLIGSWAGTAGIDAYGNSYPAGLQVGASGSSEVQLLPSVGVTFDLTNLISGVIQAAMALFTNDPNQLLPGFIGSLLLTSGTNTKMATTIGSPLGTVGNEAAYMTLESINDAGTDTPQITFGTVSSPDGGNTLIQSPVALLSPYALLVYSGAAAVTVVTVKTTGTTTIPIAVAPPSGTAKAEVWGGGGDATDNVPLVSAQSGAGAEYACEPALAITTAGVGCTVGGAQANSTLTGTSVTVTAHGAIEATPGSGSTNTVNFPGGAGLTATNGAGGGSSAGVTTAGNPGNANGNGGTAPAGGGNGGKGSTTGNGTIGAQPGGGGGLGVIGANGAVGMARLTYSTGSPTILLSAAESSGVDQFGTSYPAGLLVPTPVTWGFPVTSSLLTNGSIELGGIATPSASAGTSVLYGATSGDVETVSGSDGGIYGPMPAWKIFNGAQTISSTTGNDILGTSSPVSARKYHFFAFFLYSGGQAGATANFSLDVSAGATSPWFFANFGNGATFSEGAQSNSVSFVDSPTLTTGTWTAIMSGSFVSSGAGTFALHCEMSAGGNSVTILNGFMVLIPA